MEMQIDRETFDGTIAAIFAELPIDLKAVNDLPCTQCEHRAVLNDPWASFQKELSEIQTFSAFYKNRKDDDHAAPFFAKFKRYIRKYTKILEQMKTPKFNGAFDNGFNQLAEVQPRKAKAVREAIEWLEAKASEEITWDRIAWSLVPTYTRRNITGVGSQVRIFGTTDDTKTTVEYMYVQPGSATSGDRMYAFDMDILQTMRG